MKSIILIFTVLVMVGCGESSPSEPAKSSEVIVPEDGGEPVLAEEGP